MPISRVRAIGVDSTGVLKDPSGGTHNVVLDSPNVMAGQVLRNVYMQVSASSGIALTDVSAVIVASGVVVGHLQAVEGSTTTVGLVAYSIYSLASDGAIADQYAGNTLEIWATWGQAFSISGAPGGTDTAQLATIAGSAGYVQTTFQVLAPSSSGSSGTSGSGGTSSGGGTTSSGSSGVAPAFALSAGVPNSVAPGVVPSAQVTVTQTAGSPAPWTLTGVWMYQTVTLGSWVAQSGTGSANITMTSDGGINSVNAGRQLKAVFTLSWSGGNVSKTYYIQIQGSSTSSGGGSSSTSGSSTGGGSTTGTGTSTVPFLQNLTTTDYVVGGIGVTALVVLIAVVAGAGQRAPEERVEYVPEREYAPEGGGVA